VPPSEAAQRYLKQGEARGYHQRFLTRHRKPWYRTEQREAAPLWLGVFSRGSYKVVLNRSGALNLTSFHGFMPTLFGQRYLEALFLYLLSNAGRQVMTLSLRQYGDGLDKFEPNDLNGALVPAPSSFDELGELQLAEALAQIVHGGTLPAALEQFFASITTTKTTTRSPA
jgi:adenine-specific DNA-methyltransferase